jgi:TusA-related sulfurtransferase
MRLSTILVLSSILTTPRALAAQAHHDHAHRTAPEDSAFRAMQARGSAVMGVDQYTSVHRFDALRDGGRIELRRDHDDSASAATIRAHMRAIARAFAAGDFSATADVHDETVPGVPVMRARRSAIRYEVSDLPRGAELRIRSTDPLAVEAIHRFLAYQRREHRTGSTRRAP